MILEDKFNCHEHVYLLCIILFKSYSSLLSFQQNGPIDFHCLTQQNSHKILCSTSLYLLCSLKSIGSQQKKYKGEMAIIFSCCLV